MKSILPEWYEPDGETVEQIVKTGTIALDTNALLDLYRVGREQREQILSVLRDNSDRIFVPYQVALEFQRDRLTVLEEIDTVYAKILDGLQLKQPHVEEIRDQDLRMEVEKLFDQAQRLFAKNLTKLREKHTITFDEAREKDPVRDALDELLTDSSLGRRPDAVVLTERRSEAADRVKNRIPPGFGDADKPDPSGDYLAWAELLDHAKNSNRALLWVTNDEKKGDWYRRQRGQTIGPLPELVAEMQTVTSHPYHQTNLGSFLWLANEYLGATVEQDTIATVKKIPPSGLIDPGAQLAAAVDLSSALSTLGLSPALSSAPVLNPALSPTLIAALQEISPSIFSPPSTSALVAEYLQKNPIGGLQAMYPSIFSPFSPSALVAEYLQKNPTAITEIISKTINPDALDTQPPQTQDGTSDTP